MLAKLYASRNLPNMFSKCVKCRNLIVTPVPIVNQIVRPVPFAICRGFKSIYKNKRTYVLKTVKGVLKRFKPTGNGLLKSKHSGKSHLARNKGRARIRRLAQTKTITGVYLKKMKSLILNGK